MTERHDVVIVGGGQAGLAMSYQLKQSGIEHVVLEQAERLGETWRSQRWDSFCLVTPAWTVTLPGMPWDGLDADAFLPVGELLAYLERYQAKFALPLRLGVRVTSVERSAAGAEDAYRVETSAGPMLARNVVIAAGAFPKPHVLPQRAGVPPDVTQVHSVDYRNPAQLPPGGVLVVGSGQSGAQIAEELLEAGRAVTLSVGSCGRVPRRYRGRDIVWWLARLGFTEKRVQDLPSPAARFACKPVLSGKNGGRSIDLRELASRGLRLVGRFQDASNDGVVTFAPTVNQTLDNADKFAAAVLKDIDAHVAARGLDAPPDPERARMLGGGPPLPEATRLDLRAEGIRSIVWATGFRPEFPWVRAPVFDAAGHPQHERGVTTSPGLYFLGLAWLQRQRSDTLFGVGDDAAHLAGHIEARVKTVPA